MTKPCNGKAGVMLSAFTRASYGAANASHRHPIGVVTRCVPSAFLSDDKIAVRVVIDRDRPLLANDNRAAAAVLGNPIKIIFGVGGRQRISRGVRRCCRLQIDR
jgi:hypothetical protein